ncbi:MAG: ribosomal protein S18-alanine N-acetyltransferase [Clostridiales Family XIII bacterium]|jgi:ribosomal-protein-alanine N-acetyltransferase|nr:ribosomal protein S18-alanine N-acetyltransferase [Clostridiales Family XIII bacterium]
MKACGAAAGAAAGLPGGLPDGIEFRDASLGDAEAMAELEKLCFAIPWSLENCKNALGANSIAFYLVCLLCGELIGYAGLWPFAPEGHIMNVAVHPGFRRRGIGAALLGRLIDEAGERYGLSAFTLEVRASNEAAIRLYGRFGFRGRSRRKGYYSDTNEDAIIMWRGEPADGAGR